MKKIEKINLLAPEQAGGCKIIKLFDHFQG